MASTLYTSGTVVTSDSLNAFDRAAYNTLAAVTGTDNLTATGPLSLTAYLTGVRFFFNPQNTNTTTVTININGIGNRAITKLGNTLLIAGDLIPGKIAEIVYDGAGFQLLNPQTLAASQITGSLPFSQVSGTVPIAQGGTGATTAASARTNLVVSQTGPSFSASRITSIQTIPNSLATEVVFNGETWDTDGAFNTVNGRFTPQVAGKYQINCTLALQSDAADISTMLVYIAKNGLEYKRGEVRNTPASFPTSGSVTVSGLVDLNGTTDYVSIFAYITRSGGPSYVQFAATSPSWVDGYFVQT